jgi:hypothetical protein
VKMHRSAGVGREAGASHAGRALFLLRTGGTATRRNVRKPLSVDLTDRGASPWTPTNHAVSSRR